MIYTPGLEPFGLAPLEANACGTAVVAIAEGGVRETVLNGVNGLVVEDDDPKALGKAILKFSNNLLIAREMGEKAKVYITRNWSKDAGVDRLEHHLENAVRVGKRN